MTKEVLTDTTPPRVADHSPTGERVSPTANVTATFSEAMNRESVKAPSTVRLVKKGTKKQVPATLSYSSIKKKVTLNPTRGLSRGKEYKATVTTKATDQAGNALTKAKTWFFTVKK